MIVAGGSDGFWPGVRYGQLNNAVGHIVGFVNAGFCLPRFEKGAFVYEQKLVKAGGLTFGNVIGIYKLQEGEILSHEYAHIPQGDFLGMAYIPAHALSLTGAMVSSGSFQGHHSRFNLLECSAVFISVPAPEHCK